MYAEVFYSDGSKNDDDSQPYVLEYQTYSDAACTTALLTGYWNTNDLACAENTCCPIGAYGVGGDFAPSGGTISYMTTTCPPSLQTFGTLPTTASMILFQPEWTNSALLIFVVMSLGLGALLVKFARRKEVPVSARYGSVEQEELTGISL